MNKYVREKIKEKVEEYKKMYVLFGRDMDPSIKDDTLKLSVVEELKYTNYDLSLPQVKCLIQDLKGFNKNKNTDKRVRGSFIAISDFHSYSYPLEKIKDYYLKEYDYVFILGDACDRGPDRKGTGGITILEEIKKLSRKYPGRVIYIPGNHDSFIIGYARGDKDYTQCLIRNGGANTIQELNRLKSHDYARYIDLISWLSKLPIQYVHEFQGQKYVFAHALFNQRLYNYNPSYNLEDFFEFENSQMKKMAYNSLWFRKDNSLYNPLDLPEQDSIMVIGHTPVHNVSDTYDLEDAAGNTIKVHCVDGGIYSGHNMLKYDGGKDVNETLSCGHHDTSPKVMSDNLIDIDKERNELFGYYILNTLLTDYIPMNKSIKDYVDEEWKYFYTKTASLYNKNIADINLSEHSQLKYRFYNLACVVLFEYIIERLMEYYKNDVTAVSDRIDSYLFGTLEHPEYKDNLMLFTRYNNIRDIVEKIGSDWIKCALNFNKCKSVANYMQKKYGYNTGLVKTKRK